MERKEAPISHFDTLVWKHRNVLAGLPLAFALVSTFHEWENDIVMWPLAVTLIALGVALRTWASLHCWYGQGRARTLATTGPYAFVRNPAYLGNLLIIAGATVASELAWLTLPSIGWALLVYTRVVSYEERRLFVWFGEEWLAYRRRVPAWLPRHGLALRRLRQREKPAGHLFVACMRQGLNVLVLVPFIIKELNPFGLWWHP